MLVLKYLLYSAVTEYFLDTQLITYTVVITKFGIPAEKKRFHHCNQDHPCWYIKNVNCTHGHLLDRQYGGSSYCFNCIPQSVEQQIYHSSNLTLCKPIGSMIIGILKDPTEICGYSFKYKCFQR